MILRIIKNDLKRKKTMNFILFLFIILAAMFVSSGLNNVVAVMNGTDYFFDKANLGDYIIISNGDKALNILNEFKAEDKIKDYRKEHVVMVTDNNITLTNGKKTNSKVTFIVQSVDNSGIHYFDESNQQITSVPEGHIFVSSKFLEDNELKVGDKINLEVEDLTLSMTIDGILKDAFLGSKMMANIRFILNDKDMNKIIKISNKDIKGDIYYIDTDDVSALTSKMVDIPNIMFNGARSMIKMCYVMDMIVAFIMVILSICLILISFVVLKFSIDFTIIEEYKEIGVMKAIGISNRKIRGIYILKYLLFAIIGAIIGLILSIPFGKMLLDSVSKIMVLGNDNSLMINILASVFVIALIVLFAYLCTGKVKKVSVMDAIRQGQSGERFHSKSKLRINSFSFSNSCFMAFNDVLSNLKRFLSIIFTFGLCTLFVLILVNTTTTLDSDKLISAFGKESDLYVNDFDLFIKSNSKESLNKDLKKLEKELAQNGMPAKLCMELQYKYSITYNDKKYLLSFQQGLNTLSTDYTYIEGVVPQNANEIAITPQISDMIGAKIGDTIVIHYGDEDVECVVTAYYQTFNQMGEMIRLHEDAPTDFEYFSNAISYQIDFTDHPSKEEIEIRKDKIQELFHYDDDKVQSAKEYCVNLMNSLDTIKSVQFLLLVISIIVIIMVTILMERSFIEDEKSQIAILKAIGFQDKSIIKWQVYRFGFVALIAVILALILSYPMTKLCIDPIFAMMGAVDVQYNIDFMQIFILYPGIVLLITVLVTWIMALYTKRIKSSDATNIE